MIRRLLARLRAHGLAHLSLGFACAIACALVATIPMYSSIVGVSILRDLTDRAEEGSTAPFSYFFATDASAAPTDWESLTEASEYLSSSAADDLGLPDAIARQRLVSRRFSLTVDDRSTLAFTTVDGFSDLTDLVDGRAPRQDAPTIEALVADGGDVRTGDTLRLIDPLLPASDPDRQITVDIVGTWQATDPDDHAWIVSPSVLADQLVVPVDVFTDRMPLDRPPTIATAQWAVFADASSIEPATLSELERRVGPVVAAITERAPSISLARDPGPLLTAVSEQQADLERTMRAFAGPSAVLVSVFLLMVMSFSVQQRRTELAVLRSRGLPMRHSIGSIGAEIVAVVLAGAVVGALIAMAAAQLMVRSQSFLVFGDPANSVGFWRPIPLGWLLAAWAVLVGATLLLLIGPARTTIVERQESRGRLARASSSFLASLDLIVVAFVAAILLQRRDVPPTGLDDPWVIAIPAAAGLAIGLLTIRWLPRASSWAARVADRRRGVSAFLGSQRMARTPGATQQPVLLIVVATTLTVFVASLSLTLDQRLLDETQLTIGGDHVLVSITPGRSAEPPDVADGSGIEGVTVTAELDGRFGETKVPTRQIEVIALDPATFIGATHWQERFDDQALRELLAPLTSSPRAVVVSATLAETYDVSIGDSIRFAVAGRSDAGGETLWLDTGGYVSGIVDRFPRWTGTSKAPLLVMNLASLSAQVDRLERATTIVRAPGVDDPFMGAPGARAASGAVIDAQLRPERQAVFAVLNVTFAATMTIALLALVLQTMATFRQRRLEVGLLRSLGLRRSSIRSLLAFDFITTAVVGVLVGTAVGVATSAWLIPELLAAAGTDVELPQRTSYAWPLIALSAMAFVLVAIGVAVAASPLLARRQVFDALKLGESS